MPPPTLHPVNITMQAGPVICNRCKQPLGNLVIEEISGFAQLRSGNLLITHLESNCLYCQWKFYWNLRDHDVEKMTKSYADLMKRIDRLTPLD